MKMLWKKCNGLNKIEAGNTQAMAITSEDNKSNFSQSKINHMVCGQVDRVKSQFSQHSKN